jgi:hypothetical protein
MILFYIQRPVFQLTVIAAFAAMFVPLFPLIPPGLVFTVFYRRLWWRGRVYRAYRDMVRLPLRYFSGPELRGFLPGGEEYAGLSYQTLPEELRVKIENREIPLLIPEREAGKNTRWYVFGVPGGAETGNGDREEALPAPPRDAFAPYVTIPGNPEELAPLFNRKAYMLEIVSWALLLAGIALNALCIAILVLI